MQEMLIFLVTFVALRSYARVSELLLHPDLRDKPGCVSYVRQRITTHTMINCIEINVTNIIT
jgi:putative component of membrane protein insertase Oxa1/YidC/SpoIIIJ protein YidD